MQMMAFGAVAPNPLPFSNTPRNDYHEEVFILQFFDSFYVCNLCFLAMSNLSHFYNMFAFCDPPSHFFLATPHPPMSGFFFEDDE